MSNNKLKIFVAFSFIFLVVGILNFSPNFSVNADGDEFAKEIADYKTWEKLNDDPIKVKLMLDFSGG